jgi:RHS repeat-associated protein
VQFWSGNENGCTLPGCATAAVTIPGGQSGPTNVTINYTYDPLYRLTAADYSDGKYFHYDYDAVGNRLTQAANLAGQPATTSYTYDDANRLTSVGGVPYTYDNNGNLLSDGTNTYAYDSANRLISAVGPSGVIAYHYDGLGNRLQQNVNGVVTTYTMDLASSLTDVLDDGTTTYTYGIDRISQTTGADTEYFLGDALGSVRQLADASGVLSLDRNYDPFGNGQASAGNGNSIFGYTGEQTDRTGMVYLRAREFDPSDGRFMTRDTWGGDDKQPMSYNDWLYVYGNPVNTLDPNGRMPYECSHIDPQNWNSTQCADLFHRSESPESFPYVAPSELSWNPAVKVNLASDLLRDTPHAEELPNVSYMGPGLCGQIALAMILETITGTPDLLNEIWENTDPVRIGEKTTAVNLEPAVSKVLEKHLKAQESNWRVTTYSYQQILTYTSQGNYYEQNNQGQWYGDEQGSLIAPRFREMLQLGHYVMVLCTMKQDTGYYANPWGTLTDNNDTTKKPNPTSGHWVVLTGMSAQWDSSNEDSIWNWVRINNTYSNQEQYYPWKFFKDSMFKYNGPNTTASPSVMEIWQK